MCKVRATRSRYGTGRTLLYALGRAEWVVYWSLVTAGSYSMGKHSPARLAKPSIAGPNAFGTSLGTFEACLIEGVDCGSIAELGTA